MKLRFPHHPYFSPGASMEWFTDLKRRFKVEAKRSRTLDPYIFEDQKSEPLYRVLSEDQTVVRAKYYVALFVDVKSIATSMVKNANFSNSQKLVEFNFCRVGLGRGGGHMVALPA